MKFWKSKFIELVDRVAALEKRKIESAEDTITCETCGCLVAKHRAVKGEGEIRVGFNKETNPWYWPIKEEYIYYPYYCKRDAPKTETKKKNKEKKS